MNQDGECCFVSIFCTSDRQALTGTIIRTIVCSHSFKERQLYNKPQQRESIFTFKNKKYRTKTVSYFAHPVLQCLCFYLYVCVCISLLTVGFLSSFSKCLFLHTIFHPSCKGVIGDHQIQADQLQSVGLQWPKHSC